MRSVRGSLIVIGMVMCCLFARAQQEVTISGNFEGVSYKDFFEDLERSTGYKVYYNLADIEGLKVNLRSDSLSIQEALLRIFAESDFYFAIDPLKNIFIVKGVYLYGELPRDFFSGAGPEDTSADGAQPFRLDKSIISIGRVSIRFGTGSALVKGQVTDVSGEPVVGATIFCVQTGQGVVSSSSGSFSMSLPKGQYDLRISAVGMQSRNQKIAVYSDGKLDITLQEEVSVLKEVVIESERDINIKGLQMGVQKLDMTTMKKVTAVMGEVDVLRVILALPGVQTVGEASTGLNVRGGSASQNLILYNNAVVYNPTHLFGFFTAFNPDEIGNTELMKSAIPAERGGRLSSVIDIRSRTANKDKFVGHGGIGPLTSKLMVEAPIIKGRTSFMAGARSSYSNWLLKKVPDESVGNSRASFFDVNLSVNHDQDENNNFFLSGYVSRDRFKLNQDTLYTYTNRVFSLKWKHVFSDKLYGNFTISNSGYDYSVGSTEDKLSAFEMTYGISQSDLKAEFSLRHVEKHNVTFGVNSTLYRVKPGAMSPQGDSSLVSHDRLDNEHGWENAVFIGDNFEVNSKLSVYGGIRYSFFVALGPRDIYLYAPGVPKSEGTILDTIQVAGLQSAGSYSGPEYRLSARYLINQDLSVKASYNLMRQYLQMLSNTVSVSPTDVWKLSDTHIRPQIGSQYSVGVYKNLKRGIYEMSLEGYYKRMRNTLDYKDGADLVLNHSIESDVVNAQGTAYGAELLLKKSRGKLTGWISYTYSRSFLRTNSEFLGESVNNGEYYPSNYDKPHAINLIGNYALSHRFSVSVNSTYSTGRPITLPLAKYELDNALRLLYSYRNQFRIPDYFRIDLSINVEGNHKIKKLAHSSWTFGIYNLTGRKNIYSVFFRSDGAFVRGYKMSVFGTPIPSVTYNFRF